MIYLIIGNGKVAKHFVNYFKQLKLTVLQWHYKKTNKSNNINLENYLNNIINNYNINYNNIRILLLIKDDQIENFINKNICLKKYTYLLHFSGTLQTKLAIGTHPLMTFDNSLYNLDLYTKIPFISSSDKKMSELLPGLPNKLYKIDSRLMAYYHALCVISGNFSQILWQKCSQELEQTLNLPKDILLPYIQQVANNYYNNPDNCLTGPLQRNDQESIKKNIIDLKDNNSPLSKIYNEFCELYKKQ